MSSWAVEYFGEELVTKDGVRKTEDVVRGKRLVAIYFSAHWCPPCRGFTPILSEFYDQLREEDGHADEVEIVFISSDHDRAAFDEYYGSMPWTAVAFENGHVKSRLGEKFNVRGIPTLIVLNNSNGEIVDRDGRSTVGAAKGATASALRKWST